MVEFGTRAEYDPSNADIVIVVGYGVRNKNNLLEYIKPFADTISNCLGAKVGIGVTRKALNQGIVVDSYYQIGQSSMTIKPRIVIEVGVSGAIQHMSGVNNAGTIVAINKDPNARIFEHCDYAVVGKLEEMIPQLIEALNKIKSSN